jgi:splicing factor 45
MSLFSGIKFTSEKAKALAAAPGSSASSAPATTRESSSLDRSPVPSYTIQAISLTNVATSIPAAPTVISKPVQPPKATAEWSPALKFAPRLNKPKAARPAAGPSTIYSAAPTVVVKHATVEKPTQAVQAVDERDEDILGPDGKPLARAPAMTLGTSAKRDRGRTDGKKKKGKKKVSLCPTRSL